MQISERNKRIQKKTPFLAANKLRNGKIDSLY